jgi:hypothetical protein
VPVKAISFEVAPLLPGQPFALAWKALPDAMGTYTANQKSFISPVPGIIGIKKTPAIVSNNADKSWLSLNATNLS